MLPALRYMTRNDVATARRPGGSGCVGHRMRPRSDHYGGGADAHARALSLAVVDDDRTG